MINGVIKTREKKQYKRNHIISLENGMIYDQFWKILFEDKKDHQYFLDKIAEAEDDIKNGRFYTAEEVWEDFRKEYGEDI